jgi:TM2 domain-containing membrane protein YozV
MKQEHRDAKRTLGILTFFAVFHFVAIAVVHGLFGLNEFAYALLFWGNFYVNVTWQLAMVILAMYSVYKCVKATEIGVNMLVAIVANAAVYVVAPLAAIVFGFNGPTS